MAITSTSPMVLPRRKRYQNEKKQTAASLADRKLQICYSLQTTLQVQTLLDIFTKELKKEMPFDYFSYRYEKQNIDYHSGEMQTHYLQYNLRMGDDFLGQVKISRKTIFNNKEIECVEEFFSVLLYSIRNALEYNRALQLSLYDTLTGVLNRASLYPTIEKEMALAQRQKQPFSLLMIDVDYFKSVNDRLGHQAGDQVLRQVVSHMQSLIRKSDWLFRLGGDEFLMLLPSTDKAGALKLAERIRESVASRHFWEHDNDNKVTISIGVVTSQQAKDSNELLEAVDTALYRAKNEGRNMVSM